MSKAARSAATHLLELDADSGGISDAEPARDVTVAGLHGAYAAGVRVARDESCGAEVASRGICHRPVGELRRCLGSTAAGTPRAPARRTPLRRQRRARYESARCSGIRASIGIVVHGSTLKDPGFAAVSLE